VRDCNPYFVTATQASGSRVASEPFAMIFHELATNALKQRGRPSRQQGFSIPITRSDASVIFRWQRLMTQRCAELSTGIAQQSCKFPAGMRHFNCSFAPQV